jgi:hypothetical protein
MHSKFRQSILQVPLSAKFAKICRWEKIACLIDLQILAEVSDLTQSNRERNFLREER